MKEIRRLNSEFRTFRVDLKAAPNLSDLRRALASLIDTAQQLESDIINVTLSTSEPPS